MKNEKLYQMSFESIYILYLQKAIRKNKTKEEVDQIIFWLTGHNDETLKKVLEDKITLKDFFEQAPKINENSQLITGVICGVRVEEIQDPLMQKIRYLDKLIDELSNGKKMSKIISDR